MWLSLIYLYHKDMVVHRIATQTTQAVLKFTSLASIYGYNTNSQSDHLPAG